MIRRTIELVFILLLSGQSVGQENEPPNYNEHIRPILKESCLSCHNPDDKEGDLDLSSFAALLKGGSAGEIVKTGRPSSSRLYQSITHADKVEAMPPESPKIADSKIDLIDRWIRSGLLEGPDSKPKSSGLRSVKVGKAIVSPEPDLNQYPDLAKQNLNRAPIPKAIASSPGASLFAVSGHKRVLLFGTNLGNESIHHVASLDYPEGTIHDIKFSRNGSLLIVAGGVGAKSGNVVIFDVKSSKRLAEIGDEFDSILAADLSFDHKWLAIGNSKKVVKIYDASDGKLVHQIKKHTDWITSISFANQSDHVATGDRSGGVFVWEAAKGGIVLNLSEHKVRVNDVDWRSDDKVLVSGAEDGNIIVWSMKDGFPVSNVKAHIGKSNSRHSRYTGVLSIRFFSDGSMISSGRDRVVKLWKPNGQLQWKKEMNSIPVQVRSVNNMSLVGLFNGNMVLLNEQGEIIKELENTSAK